MIIISSINIKYITTTEARKKFLQTTQFFTFLKYKPLNYLVNFRVNNRRAILLIAKLKFYQYTKYIKL